MKNTYKSEMGSCGIMLYWNEGHELAVETEGIIACTECDSFEEVIENTDISEEDFTNGFTSWKVIDEKMAINEAKCSASLLDWVLAKV